MTLDQATLDDIVRDLNFKRTKFTQNKSHFTVAQLLKMEQDIVRLELELFQALGAKYFNQFANGVTDVEVLVGVTKSRAFDSANNPRDCSTDS